jgi:hypothetical protein
MSFKEYLEGSSVNEKQGGAPLTKKQKAEFAATFLFNSKRLLSGRMATLDMWKSYFMTYSDKEFNADIFNWDDMKERKNLPSSYLKFYKI